MEKHFCVSVYIYDEITRKILLVKHKKMGMWVQPGGHIEPNETPEEAAVRETYEETGLNVELLGKRKPRDIDFIVPLAIQNNKVKEDHYHMDFVYLAKVIGDNNLIKNEDETDGIAWFTLEEVKKEGFKTFDDVIEWFEYIINNYNEIN